MKKILIASGNRHKIKEIRFLLKDIQTLRVLSTADFGITANTIEDGDTLELNSYKKAREVYEILKIPALADDTGLFVNVLNGAPGVLSARYSGENATYESNCIKILNELKSFEGNERKARFETVLCLYKNEKEHFFFKGICNGIIINNMKGKNGFGYDPVFIPDGYKNTFAEIPEDEKNKISHRANALYKFKDYIKCNFE
jgi:XTP/dITP diphosphohydrolase